MKSDLDGADVEVRSVHSFICLLLKKLDFYESAENDGDFFQTKYESGKNEMLACLEAGALAPTDIQEVVKANYDELGWDIILIDEGQDWPKNEKDLLFRLFEPRHFIVADGVDQLVRNEEKTDWMKGVDHHRPTAEKRSLRQKANLCRFENQYASIVGLNWDIEPKLEFHGGKVIIVPGAYTCELHKRLKSICQADGNTPYEMLFSVPPSLVDQSYGFKLTNEWLGWDVGIAIWDGTQKNTRSDYPRHIDQYRVVQYQSCRGLEGWIAVCLWLDEFVSYKKWEFEQSKEKKQRELIPSVDKDTFAYRWSMIPMTRAVDTLVITLRNPQSEYARLLRKLQQANEDFVEWVG